MTQGARGQRDRGVSHFGVRSLRQRLLVLVVLAVLPPLILILTTAWQQRRQSADDAQRDALRVARLASTQHERLLEGTRSLLIGLAQLSDVQMHNSRACSALFTDVQRRFPLYRTVGAIRPDGHVFCVGRPTAGASNVADRGYFRDAMTTRDFAVSGYRLDRASGTPILTLSYPAIDRADDVWAVVFAQIDFGWLAQLADSAALPAESTISIADATGRILARYPEDAQGRNAIIDPAVAQAARRDERERTTDTTDAGGGRRLLAFTPLAGLPDAQRLYVTVSIPTRIALAEADRLLRRNFLWAGVVLLLAIMGARVVSDLFIVRRVSAVVRAAHRLAAGDLSARADAAGRDEIGALARSFNAMAERLEDRVRDEHEAKEELADSVNELNLLNEMGEALQSCFSLEDAYAVIGRLAPRLFQNASGAVLRFEPGQGRLDPIATWGTPPPDLTALAVPAAEAIGADGRTELDESALLDLCRQLTGARPASRACIPLLGEGKPLGVLFVATDSVAPRSAEATHRLAETVAAQLGLGLMNVQLREVLRIQSIHDSLTGLFNRRYMEETLDREVHRARRIGRPMAVLMLDVDSFKQQNDRFGHDGGDAVLRELGTVLRTNLRKEDIACRYGGEEFVLVLPDASLDAAWRRAEQMRETVKQLRIPYRGHVIGPITVSIGVAGFPEHGSDAASLIQSADTAMYQAKREGRDRVSMASLHPV